MSIFTTTTSGSIYSVLTSTSAFTTFPQCTALIDTAWSTILDCVTLTYSNYYNYANLQSAYLKSSNKSLYETNYRLLSTEMTFVEKALNTLNTRFLSVSSKLNTTVNTYLNTLSAQVKTLDTTYTSKLNASTKAEQLFNARINATVRALTGQNVALSGVLTNTKTYPSQVSALAFSAFSDFYDLNNTTVSYLTSLIATDYFTGEFYSYNSGELGVYTVTRNNILALSAGVSDAYQAAILKLTEIYTNTPALNAKSKNYTGVGNAVVGELGYRYVTGNLLTGANTIGGVSLTFFKGLAFASNTLSNGRFGSIYYKDGLTTTLDINGNGTWKGETYVNGVVRLRSINNDFALYTPKDFPIYTIFKKNADIFTTPSTFNIVVSAIDYLSAVLKGTSLTYGGMLVQDLPSVLYSPSEDDYILNPMLDIIDKVPTNNGFVLLIDEDNPGGNGVLGAASLTHIRLLPGTPLHNQPCVGFFYLNTYYAASMKNTIDPAGRSELYTVVVHETMHSLGIGTCWHMPDYSQDNYGKIRRSFTVGAGDDTVFPGNSNTKKNIFYTTATGSSAERIDSSVGTLGFETADASYGVAYNPNNTVSTNSAAVSAYNAAWNKRIRVNNAFVESTVFNNLALTAIPLENGMGPGSYGGHWLEGGSRSYDPTGGLDFRKYYNNRYPGAPGLKNEIMTPVSEGVYRPVPISQITFGALTDLGYTVDNTKADNYTPAIHSFRTETVGTSGRWEISLQDTGFYQKTYSTNNFHGKLNGLWLVDTIRIGVAYTMMFSTTIGTPPPMICIEARTLYSSSTIKVLPSKWKVVNNIGYLTFTPQPSNTDMSVGVLSTANLATIPSVQDAKNALGYNINANHSASCYGAVFEVTLSA